MGSQENVGSGLASVALNRFCQGAEGAHSADRHMAPPWSSGEGMGINRATGQW